MRKCSKVFLLQSVGVLLTGCAGGEPVSIKDEDLLAEEDDTGYEWQNLKLAESAEDILSQYERKEPFTYSNNGEFYVKCLNGDFLCGKRGNFSVFSKIKGDYKLLKCNSETYSYHDMTENVSSFYNKLTSNWGKWKNFSEIDIGETFNNYEEAVSVFNTTINNYYAVDTQVISGLICDTYVSYGSKFKDDFIITRYADRDENKFNTYFTGLDYLKHKISSYKVERTSSRKCYVDSTNTIKFDNLYNSDMKELRNRLFELERESDGKIKIYSDDYVESIGKFNTVVRVLVDKMDNEDTKGSQFWSTMTFKYGNKSLEYSYTYPTSVSVSTKAADVLGYAGEGTSTETSKDVFTFNLATSNDGSTPRMPQTDQNYINYNRAR